NRGLATDAAGLLASAGFAAGTTAGAGLGAGATAAGVAFFFPLPPNSSESSSDASPNKLDPFGLLAPAGFFGANNEPSSSSSSAKSEGAFALGLATGSTATGAG